MSAYAEQAGARPSLTFCLTGLSLRDETLFKSFVRLLAHRTLQHWTFAPAGGDVCVVTQEALHNVPSGQKTLVVGSARRGEMHFVSMPFHADELEQALNKAGAAFTASLHAARPASEQGPGAFRLLRWPPSALVRCTDHMRLATMMTGKVTSLAKLQERAGIPMDVCASFVADLKAAGLLADVATIPAAPAAENENLRAPPRHVEAGLISRIRNRLGLFSAGRT